MVVRVRKNAVSVLCFLLGVIVITAVYSFPSLSSDAPDYARQWTNDALASFGKHSTDESRDELANSQAPEKPIIDNSDKPDYSSHPMSDDSTLDPTLDTTLDHTVGAPSVSAADEQKEDKADKEAEEKDPKEKDGSSDPEPTPHPGFTSEAYYQIFSNSTKNGNYFPIDFASYPAINPNIIPHPKRADTWIIVAQKHKVSGKETPFFFVELVCDAVFKKDHLVCEKEPWILPIAATKSGNCSTEIGWMEFNAGPHDARVLWGPKFPYIVYGSNSQFNCFGIWMQDFRLLTAWPEAPFPTEPFRFGTDLQRPPPIGSVEKNWFPFWDEEGDIYLHYDVAPQRVFAKLEQDGSVGPNLGDQSAATDTQCIAKYWPKMDKDAPESVHQGSNSLSITMCKRTDPDCKRTADNTFIMHIFQHKKFYAYHSVYEPYVMLFRQNAPFDLYAISSKPFWIHGRKTAEQSEEIAHLKGQTEMFYITSINWKDVGLHYHGYMDDVIMLGFGIEDRLTGGIDVVAADLVQELGMCDGGSGS